MNKLKTYTEENEMRINKKTKVMLFNTAVKYDFMPDDGEFVEVVENFKLILASDLKWHMNTKHITTKGFQRLWMLRRLKQLGASQSELIAVYVKKVRSILEFATVVWNSGLTKENIAQIERVQQSAFSIILGQNCNSYDSALQALNMETLSIRSEALSIKFAKKAAQHPRHSTWFKLQPQASNTRSVKPQCKLVYYRRNLLYPTSHLY